MNFNEILFFFAETKRTKGHGEYRQRFRLNEFGSVPDPTRPGKALFVACSSGRSLEGGRMDVSLSFLFHFFSFFCSEWRGIW